MGNAGEPPEFRMITFHTDSHLSAWIDLRRLLTDFCGIDDEFERIRVLILFHQLQTGEPFSALYRIVAWELDLRRFEQIRGHRVLTVRVKGGSLLSRFAPPRGPDSQRERPRDLSGWDEPGLGGSPPSTRRSDRRSYRSRALAVCSKADGNQVDWPGDPVG